MKNYSYMTSKNKINVFPLSQKMISKLSKSAKHPFGFILLMCILFLSNFNANAQINNAQRSGFTWISTENIVDTTFGYGYSMYSAAWPIFKNYPGPNEFQMGLGSSWLTTQHTGNEPEQFYTTIEGGLGWWHDTRFGTEIPKFIMGGVSYNFYAWANGPGAGKTGMLSNGQRDWSEPGGKYGVAQLSNTLLWAPDGLNMAQSLNGEMLGYGWTPLPLTEIMSQTNGYEIETGNQCWTLFLNSTNFKGPVAFFLPTFWTKPVIENPSLEGLFLDSRPSNPNVGLGMEHAQSPALISEDSQGNKYAKIERLQFPTSNQDNSMILNQFSVYSKNALWNNMEAWFNGGNVVSTELNLAGTNIVPFINNGGSMMGEISETGSGEIDHPINLSYIDNIQQNENIMGYQFNLENVYQENNNFILPEYFELNPNNEWQAITEDVVPLSTNLVSSDVPSSPRSEIAYLTPLDPECQWQDPNGPWNSPGPSAGPFQVDMGDGSTLTYYWYRFVDQPAIIHANLSDNIRELLQTRVELIHTNWNHSQEYLADPQIGKLATLDPQNIVQPPLGLEIGYVPIVTKQAKTESKIRVFVLAGQSNMEGFGTVEDSENDPGSLTDVIQNDEEGNWSEIGELENWNSLDNAYLYFANNGDTIKTNVTVGQGNDPNLIGAELMFAYQLDEYYEDPVLIIKTAWGGKNLAVDFRPPSAGGETGEYYNKMIETIQEVTQNLTEEFPNIGSEDFEISGFTWFQGWNDGASESFLNEYESNLYHLVNDVRNDLDSPELPVVIANSGHGGFAFTSDGWVQDMQNIVSLAQENVGCDDFLYGGKVGFVETKQYYLEASVSPSDAVYHYNNNALSYLNIGKAMGEEMILTINDMAFCYTDCVDQIPPGIVSIGNRVWNDYNMDGNNDPNEPGISGVSVLIWADSDGDNIPDWQGFGGVEVTDEEGYYNFSGLEPGNYSVFVWQVDNWGPGEPLEGFQSTNGFEPNANNDQDLDNNGYGSPFSDIMSGVITLSSDGEPLGDGDPFNCYFNYDASGNNTVDFGFFNPNFPGDEPECQIIDLPLSWSTFSTYMLPVNMDLEVVLSLILDKIIIVKDYAGNAYLPDYQFNGVGVMQLGQGYQIKTTETVSIEICGEYASPQNHLINLIAGWNLLGYLRTEPADISAVLSDVNDGGNLIIAKDYEGNAYLPMFEFNGIGDMKPGEGYQIKTINTDVIQYLSNNESY